MKTRMKNLSQPGMTLVERRARGRNQREDRMTDIERIEYAKADRDYAYFYRLAWEVIEPKTPLLFNWHHALIAEYLTACYKREIKRLIINMPPRYAKSNMVTVTWPAWVWAQNPAERFMFTSYSSGLSVAHNISLRTVIESPWYQKGWACTCGKNPHDVGCKGFRLSADQNVKAEFVNDRRGHMLATSMGGTATGKGGNILIVDDPHDVTRAASDTMRTADNLEFDQKFSTRLDDKKDGVIIVVMQRLHNEDLTGHILANEKDVAHGGDWHHLKLEGEAEQKTIIVFPRSKKVMERQEGEPLHAAREDKAALAKQRVKLGPYGYATQYQQSEAPREGGLFKRDKWMRYESLPADMDLVMDFWDMSFKDLQGNDWVCGQVWGLKGPHRFLIYMTMRLRGFEDSLNASINMRPRFPQIMGTVIEDKANGPAIISVAKNKISGLQAFDPGSRSKEERAAAIEPVHQAGNIWLPIDANCDWDVPEEYLGTHVSAVEAFIDNCAKFPNVKQDGDIDCLTMANLYFNEKQNLMWGNIDL